MIALVDCNNFYVSCERVFSPHLNFKAVVVLSNNDGCVVSRSNEAKLLGVKMAAPYFQVKAEFNDKIIAISSNYALYADMSKRVMTILKEFAPIQEIYSIDECFLNFSGISVEEIEIRCQDAIKRVQMWIGLPISIGIAQTKTEAKLAANLAKKFPKRFNGLCNIYDFDSATRDKIYEKISAVDVWGVGKKTFEKLVKYHILTVKELKNTDYKNLKSLFSVNLEKIILELNGVPVIKFEDIGCKKQIMVSRSFSKPITTIEKLEIAVSKFCERVCEKLRNQNSFATTATLFISTNRFEEMYFAGTEEITFNATNNTLFITHSVLDSLRKLFRVDLTYKRAGIILSGIREKYVIQNSLFDPIDEVLEHKKQELMKTLDKVNQKFANSIELASSVSELSEHLTRDSVSPHYTTRLEDIIKVK
ncbi:MAG: Y-family DNA polymerase [Fusobacteria bacterium]|nr:Y-family DNA polymerase [Fusobacteriota bacterium]